MSDTVRMGSALTTIGLPVALGIIMFGLGLALTPRDFARVGRHPKAVIIALLSLARFLVDRAETPAELRAAGEVRAAGYRANAAANRILASNLFAPSHHTETLSRETKESMRAVVSRLEADAKHYAHLAELSEAGDADALEEAALAYRLDEIRRRRGGKG